MKPSNKTWTLSGVSPDKLRGISGRFERHVQFGTGCWLWTGAKQRQGYGLVWVAPHDNLLAHRVSFALANLDVDIRSVESVCHHCDVPSCVRPDHLFAGTNAENLRDMYRKGRSPRDKGTHCYGVRHPKAKFTEEQIAWIRLRVAGSEKQCDIANEFGVSRGTIGQIVRRSTWRHVS